MWNFCPLYILCRIGQDKTVKILKRYHNLQCLTMIFIIIINLSHTFVEIDHEIISTFILLPSAESFKKGCCQLQAKVCAGSTGYLLVQACPGKSVVR